MALKYPNIGFFAATLTAGGLSHQLYRIIQRQSANDISYVFLGSMLVTRGLWLIFSTANNITPSIYGGIFGLVIATIMMYLKIHYAASHHHDDPDDPNAECDPIPWCAYVGLLMLLSAAVAFLIWNKQRQLHYKIAPDPNDAKVVKELLLPNTHEPYEPWEPMPVPIEDMNKDLVTENAKGLSI